MLTELLFLFLSTDFYFFKEVILLLRLRLTYPDFYRVKRASTPLGRCTCCDSAGLVKLEILFMFIDALPSLLYVDLR